MDMLLFMVVMLVMMIMLVVVLTCGQLHDHTQTMDALAFICRNLQGKFVFQLKLGKLMF